MHASIFMSFEAFTRARCSEPARAALEREVPASSILPFKTYPDALAVAALGAVARAEGEPPGETLRRFGRFFPSWARLHYTAAFSATTAHAFLLGVARAHAVAASISPGATPPEIQVVETGPGRLEVSYASPRRMCALVHGMLEGLSELYAEPLEIREGACISQGAAACRFDVRFPVPSRPGPRA
jgi:Haem-NO-binding